MAETEHTRAAPVVTGGETAPLLSTLVERLRGIYRLGVNDGAGLLNGKDTFTRQFETPPIQRQAADRIEALEAALRDAALNLDACAVAIKRGGKSNGRHILAEGWAERARLAISRALGEGGGA